MRTLLLLLTGFLYLYTPAIAQYKHFNKPSLSATASKAIPLLAKQGMRSALNRNMNTVNFVPNNGQYDKKALYTFCTPQAQMIIYDNKLRLVSLHSSSKIKNGYPAVKDKQYVDILFTGANQLQPVAHYNQGTATYNYFTSEKNVTNVKTAAEIYFNNIYKGVTLRLYSNKNGSLEFDWLVNEPLQYTQIRMQFTGQSFLKVDKSGELEIGLRFGSLKLKIPETYQADARGKRLPLQAKFAYASASEVKYAIKGTINPRLPLVIDPVLQWGAYMDGDNANFDAYLYGGVADGNGDIYVCGSSQRITDTDIQSSAYGNSSSGYLSTPPSGVGTGVSGASGDGVDWLIMKVKSDGSKVLTYTFFGLSTVSTTQEQAHCIDISPDGGSVFVGGVCAATSSSSQSLPALSAGYTGNTAFGGTSTTTSAVPAIAVFTIDLSSLKYRTFIGNGTRQGDICSIEALNDNDYVFACYVNGTLGNGSGSVAYVSGADNTYSNGYDIYIAKFTNLKTRTWGTYIGGDGNDKVFDMRLLSNNDVAFCGYASSTNNSLGNLTNEVASTANRGNGINSRDALVGVLKSDGSAFNMLSKVGGSGSDEFDGLQVGPCDTLYLTGTTSSSNFPNIGSGVLQTSNGGGTSDMIIFKCPAAGGNTGVGSYYGGSSLDIGNSIVFIPVGSGRVFIFGTTQSTATSIAVNNISGNSFFNNSNSGSYDMFFLECSPDFKTLYFATYVGGSDMDYLGDTGSQVTGKQMVMVSDSTIGVFTTTHSSSLSPNIISSSGVFDNTKSNGGNDTWTIFIINIEDSYGNIDAGDAPASYGKATVEIAKSGSNAIVTLGNRVDEDSYYPISPGTTTLYDDNEGNSMARKPGNSIYYNNGLSGSPTISDEDALNAGSVTAVEASQTTYTLDIPYYNNSGTTSTLYGSIDFNIDGDFDDANERVYITGLASSPAAAGSATRTATLNWTIPAGVVLGNTYLRLMMVEGTGSGSVSGSCSGSLVTAQNQANGLGEVEDYKIVISSVLLTKALKFQAYRNNNNSTITRWQLNGSTQVDYSEVERSSDGINFNSIGKVKGDVFRFVDNNFQLHTKDQYYRLKVVGKPGIFYSEIVKVPATITQLSVYASPNPFKQVLRGNIATTESGIYNVAITNTSGQVFFRQKQWLQKGNNSLLINETASLAAGVYWLRVSNNNETVLQKVVKQ